MAQSGPNWASGYVPTPSEWETTWETKQDHLVIPTGGSNSREIADALGKPHFDLHHFGFVEGNTSTHTSALQAAFNALGVDGGELILYSNVPVIINAPIDWVITAAQRATSTSGSDLHFTDVAVGHVRCLGNFEIQAGVDSLPYMIRMIYGSGSSQGLAGEQAPYWSGLDNIFLNGAGHLPAEGLRMEWTFHNTVDRCRIDGCTIGIRAFGRGVHHFRGTTVRAQKCFVFASSDGATTSGDNYLWGVDLNPHLGGNGAARAGVEIGPQGGNIMIYGGAWQMDASTIGTIDNIGSVGVNIIGDSTETFASRDVVVTGVEFNGFETCVKIVADVDVPKAHNLLVYGNHSFQGGWNNQRFIYAEKAQNLKINNNFINIQGGGTTISAAIFKNCVDFQFSGNSVYGTYAAGQNSVVIDGSSWGEVLNNYFVDAVAQPLAIVSLINNASYINIRGNRVRQTALYTYNFVIETSTTALGNVFGENYIDPSMIYPYTSNNPNTQNGEQLKLVQLGEITTMAAAAFTDTTIQIPARALVVAVSVLVTTAIPTATTFSVGVSGATTRYGTGIGVAQGTAYQGTDAGILQYGSAAAIRITPSSTPVNNSGRVHVTIHYIQVNAPLA